MNEFQQQLEQSQDDAYLHRWEYSYRMYFPTMYGKVNKIINTDTLPDHEEWQLGGVDHIVECEACDVFCDFMLRETTYTDFFLEYEVNGKPGKFNKDSMLTHYVAYSYRRALCVYLFPYPQARAMVRQLLETGKPQFRRKTSVSTNGRQWQTKGIIVPHNYAFEQMDVKRIDKQ